MGRICGMLTLRGRWGRRPGVEVLVEHGSNERQQDETNNHHNQHSPPGQPRRLLICTSIIFFLSSCQAGAMKFCRDACDPVYLQVSFLRKNLTFRVEPKSYDLTEEGQPAHMERLVDYIRCSNTLLKTIHASPFMTARKALLDP